MKLKERMKEIKIKKGKEKWEQNRIDGRKRMNENKIWHEDKGGS